MEKKRARDALSRRCHGDGPSTIYDCPVCHQAVSLKNVSSHIGTHRKNGEVNAENADLVNGLQYVANKVVKAYKGHNTHMKKIDLKYRLKALKAAQKGAGGIVSGGLPSLGKKR
tara:strand:- start:261 stop:602 length:342 start_codon:yes stop_codon:yes gene_type:complete